MDQETAGKAAKIYLKNIEAGRQVLLDVTKQCREPMKVNEALLMRILDENKDTEYGKKYHFSEIKSVEDYQKNVPVSIYDDYIDYILRMTENGEENLITASPIHHYNKSSGTMGTPKRIPLSDEQMEQYNLYMKNLPFGVIDKEIGHEWTGGKTIRIAESTAEETFLPCKASYGALSQKLTRQFRPYLPILYTSPDEATFPVSGTDTRYLHARFALAEPGATGMVCAFYSYLLEMLRYIEKNWEMLADDIEKGTIDASVKIPEEVKATLAEKIKPMPERAEELREIFAKGFEEPFVPKVWKNMAYMIGIGTGGFKTYADMIKEKYTGDGIHMVKLGIGSSEGFVSATYRLDSEDTVLLPNSLFYEFLPLDAGDDFSQIVTIDKVEQGKDYELILTNVSGLYRYRTRDAVHIESFYENTPTVCFLYRIDQTVSIMGEKTTEEALRTAAFETAKELGFDLVDFSVYPDLKAEPVRYQYFMEISDMPHDIPPKLIRHVLEEKLAGANPSMGEKVRNEVCGATRLNFLEDETYLLYHDMMVRKGAASSQIKPVHVITNTRQRKFFFSQTMYSVEIMK